MKVLLCSFEDLVDRPGTPDRIGQQHLPFQPSEVDAADIVAVIGDGRALVLKNRLCPRGLFPWDAFANFINSGITP